MRACTRQQQVDDLRLDRDVERRDRLVGDQELGLDDERPGDADALALPAGELVRDSARRSPAAGPTRSQHRADPLAPLRRGSGRGSWTRSGADRMLLDGHARVQRRERVLEDQLHAAAQRPQLPRATACVMSWPSN